MVGDCLAAAPIGERLEAQLGYTRLHQNYSNILAIASAPNRNNAWVSHFLSIRQTAGKVTMPEDFEERPGESINLEQYLAIVRRRRWYFLVPLFVGWLMVWGVSWILPSVYRSGTLILVEQPTVPSQYVVPNIADRQFAGPATEHHAADLQPHPAHAHYREPKSLCRRPSTANAR